jgi:2-polyprenyl-3-methyl-5-hydroxy-6-metoxy-1,4-benzoquinol methylase
MRNLLCRLPDPAEFLRACARLVKPGGVLVLVSPYSWLEAGPYTQVDPQLESAWFQPLKP